MQKLLLVSHTHWDREWYLTFEEYRTRLVATYDEVLDTLEQVPAFHSFAFDGQTAPVCDYLEVRPEALERLQKQVAAKRLLVGPLYVIPDGYAPTGEAWVHNFLLGLEHCAMLGGDPGYLYMAEPTSLPEQFPQIVRRLGFDSVVFGRGLAIDQRDGSPVAVNDGEYLWDGGDGSRLLAVHMPAAYEDAKGARCILHYCNAAEVLWGPEYDPLREQERTVRLDSVGDALERIRILREYLTPLATSDALLLMHGCDHLPPQRETPELIERVNERLEGAKLMHASFADYLDAVRKAGKAHVVRQGESRARGGAMSRVFLRRLNLDAQTLLERWMEPAAALAWRRVGSRRAMSSANISNPTDRGLMRLAWRYVLQNHAHDTIWGACVDEVYDEALVRFRKSWQIAEEITKQAHELLAERVNTKSLKREGDARSCVVFNQMGWPQTEVFEAEFWLPPNATGPHLRVVDDAGTRWLSQVLEWRPAIRRTDRFRRMARVEPVTAVRALIKAERVPSTGWRAVAVEGAREGLTSDLVARRTRKAVWMENGLVRVAVHDDGSFDLTDKATGRMVRALNRLVDQGDRGNGWRFGRVERDELFATSDVHGTVRIVENGPVRASVEAHFKWRLPKGLTADGHGRDREAVVCPLTVRISLLSGMSRVEVRTVIENRVKNHRVRAYFPTDVRAAVTQANGAFAVHERPIYLTDPSPLRNAKTGIGFHPTTAEELGMMESFVDASDTEKGVALLTKGVPQYEVQKDRSGNVVFVLTLMRAAVGHTAIHDPDLTHGAQCPGEQAAEYALVLHRGNWLAGGVHQEAASYLAPPRMIPTTWHDGPDPTTGAWINALPPEIVLSALKRSEDGKSVVVRLVSLVRTPHDATVTFRDRPEAVCRASLREEPQQPLVVSPDASVDVRFAPMEIVTLRLDW